MLEIAAAAFAFAVSRPPKEQISRIEEPGQPALSVYHEPGSGPPVLYVHGATFPIACSVAYRADGKSWADDLHDRGFDVWSFDFAGYGASDRPVAMNLEIVARGEVPGRAPDAAHQIERVVRFIRVRTQESKVSLIAHSWGTIPAGLFAGSHAAWIDRLVMFGPVAKRDAGALTEPMTAPYRLAGKAEQWKSFQSGVPRRAGSPINRTEFRRWIAAYLATDPASAGRKPASVRMPAGATTDIEDAWNGKLAYDPSLIRVPTLVVRGEWDPVTRDADADWLVHAMGNVPGGAVDVKLRGGAHRMHLETNRQALFDAVGKFLAESFH